MKTRLRVGVAIGRASACATWRSRGEKQHWHASLANERHTAPSIDVLRDAFGQLRERISDHAKITLAIAILPPLARVRQIELPPMSDDERRLAVSRAAERYFVGLVEPVVCAVERCERNDCVGSFIAAAVATGVISDLEQLAGENGWTIGRVVPAHSAWTVTAISEFPKGRRTDREAFARCADETTLLVIRSGKLVKARRLRSSDAPPTESIVLGSAVRSTELIAADGALQTRSFEFVSDHARDTRAAAAARVSRWLTGIAAASVVASGAVSQQRLSRELELLARQRMAIRAQVSAAIASRDTLDQLRRSIDAIQSLDASSPRWSKLLSQIAVALPRDASLLTLRADGDSLNLDGQAADAAASIAALRSVPGIVSARPTTSIRQEYTAGENAVERWGLVLHVARTSKGLSRE